MNVVALIDVWMMLEYNVVLNGAKWTQFEYVHKVFDKMPQWQLYWLFS